MSISKTLLALLAQSSLARNLLYAFAIYTTSMVPCRGQGGVLWKESFEGEDFWDRWHVEGGVWAVGVPSSGPGRAFAGQRCAATVLNGDYPPSADARLVRDQAFFVPLNAERPRLRFWHWFSAAPGDLPAVEVKVGSGSWQPLAPISGWTRDAWSRPLFDLSPFIGLAIQISFHFQSDSNSEVGPGWYIDEVSVESGPPGFDPVNKPEGFETGLGEWLVDHGTWKVGVPTAAFDKAFKGIASVGTVLDAAYSPGVDARLISPEFLVPDASDYPRLRFYHWFSTFPEDPGQVEISVAGQAWQPLSPKIIKNSAVWTRPSFDLTPYAGQMVQLAFHFVSNEDQKVALGWYIDEVVVETGPPSWPIGNAEGFEAGVGAWSVENGLWEAGTPSFGPIAAFKGSTCVGTVLDSNYIRDSDSRLISPELVVPPAADNPRLRFWHWLRNRPGDPATVEIRIAGGEWTPLSSALVAPDGNWVRPLFALNEFANKRVQIAFHFQSNSDDEVGAGWFIDEVVIETGPFQSIVGKPEGFELGMGDWAVDKGTWEVGVPTHGPSGAFAGRQCAGTVLDGDYRNGVDSRLISPPFVVPAAKDSPRLRFWHWFSSFPEDTGVVEISVSGGPWQPLSQPFRDNSAVWTRPSFDLKPFTNQTVQIAFRFQSDGENVATGWYIDEVVVETGFDGLTTMNQAEGFEDGLGNWSVDAGTWEVGVPFYGPRQAFRGNNAAGTVLRDFSGYYFANVDSRLLSPEFTVPCAEASPRLRFAHWYDFGSGDEGTVEIKAVGEPWQTVVGPIIGSSGEWITGFYDLTPFAGKRIQIGFRFRSNNDTSVSWGWYIDEIRVQAALFPPIQNFDVAEGTLLSFPLISTCQNFRFRPGSNPPPGFEIDPAFGIVTWIPSEEQGPGTYPIEVCLVSAEDTGTVECTTFIVNVTETNDSPSLDPVGSKLIKPGQLLQFHITAFDPDRPVLQQLTFSLDIGAPPGAAIDPATGLFTWTPTETQAAERHMITVRVTDDGIPPKSSTTTFLAAPNALSSDVRLTVKRDEANHLSLLIEGGSQGTDYVIQTATQLKSSLAETPWREFKRFRSEGSDPHIEEIVATGQGETFYRVVSVP